jgi:hypothetical protein
MLNAKDAFELHSLETISLSYRFASARTQRRWRRAAAKRRKELK